MILGMDILKHTEQVRARLQASPASHIEIHQASGGDLSVSWLSKFGRGVMANPSVQTLAMLEQTLDRIEDRAA
jgi:hypothetical protein